MASREFTRAEVAKHNTQDSLWLIIDSEVWDVTSFLDLHPGGKSSLLDDEVAGQDATEFFFGLHLSSVLKKYERLKIGIIKGERPTWTLPKAGEFSKVPFAEPSWLSEGYTSPYFNNSHRALAEFMRKFVDEHVIPEAQTSEEHGRWPSANLLKKMADANISKMRFGPGKWLHGLILPGGLKGEDFTYLHEMIVTQELVRLGARGFLDGLQGGVLIGLPPIVNFGTNELHAAVLDDIYNSRKHVSLAITEPYAGSDVANIRTKAVKSPDGQHWIVSGAKKWITGGMWSDYFVVACRTGKNKLTAVLVERGEGVETKSITTAYGKAAGTAYVTFDQVKVPISHTLGEEGKGLSVILSNFNHERWIMACLSIQTCRTVLQHTLIWASLRKAFGRRLIDQPVIRQKFGLLFAKLESAQANLEYLTYQMCQMSYEQQSEVLAGQIGFLKVIGSQLARDVADECVQIFGGRGITKGGMGGIVERFMRTYRIDRIGG